jgi:pimeloyl-ACP methyl ester carboxylesterase
MVLLHEFGASSFYWRDNIPEFSKQYNVYAMDLLGFGASDKPLSIEYTPELWRNQTVAFVKKIYYDNHQPVVLIGNSLGGYLAIHSAIDSEICHMIKAVIILNPVGLFRNVFIPLWFFHPSIFYQIFQHFQNNLSETLKQLYPYHPERVDKTLINSIQINISKLHENMIISQIYYKHPYMEDILSKIKIPVYILKGKTDSWMPNLYSIFLENCPTAFGKNVDAGHFPHDEIPDEINRLILSFLTLIK